jgi:MYXO-CTERM domain-containing protein
MRIALGLMLLVAAAPAHADDCHSSLMVVLDRSCSMQQPPQPGGTKSKWVLAGEALQTVTTKYNGLADYGLIMFPDQTGQSCLQDGPIYVNVGPGNETKVVQTVMTTMPNGPCMTPIKPAFDQVSTDPRFSTKYSGMGPRGFVLFISDGMQTCGGSDAMIEASIKMLYDNGYPSYIVGFGGQVSPTALDAFAKAGGVPRATGGTDGGGHLYYQADDATQLDAALDEIVGKVSTAEFGGCPGTPCPDGRCFVSGETCISGFCQTTTTSGDGGGANGDGGGTGGNGKSSGCGCRVGGSESSATAFVILLVAAVMLWRASRRRS